MFRRAEIKPLCVTCRELAQYACLRCGRPLCGEHRHAEDRRCDWCEAIYAKRVKRKQRAVAACTLLLQLAVAPSFVVFGRPSIDSRKWQQRVRSLARTRFLEERK